MKLALLLAPLLSFPVLADVAPSCESASSRRARVEARQRAYLERTRTEIDNRLRLQEADPLAQKICAAVAARVGAPAGRVVIDHKGELTGPGRKSFEARGYRPTPPDAPPPETGRVKGVYIVETGAVELEEAKPQ